LTLTVGAVSTEGVELEWRDIDSLMQYRNYDSVNLCFTFPVMECCFYMQITNCVCYIFCIYREEPQQGSVFDEPWNTTVKGPHPIKPPNDETANHKIPQKVQNGSGPPLTKSPPKDSNLNHYRGEKTAQVSMIIALGMDEDLYGSRK
jgi:hypothetical protein